MLNINHLTVNYFHKKSFIVDVRLSSKHASEVYIHISSVSVQINVYIIFISIYIIIYMHISVISISINSFW